MKKICLLGASLDTYNRGVSALAASFVKIISELEPLAEVTLLIGGPSANPKQVYVSGVERTVKVANYRLSFKAPLHTQIWWIVLLACIYRFIPIESLRHLIARTNRWIGAVHVADIVTDVRGGDSFSDIYGLRTLILHSLPRLAILIMGKSLILLPQTYGPFKHKAAWHTAALLIRAAQYLMCRDRQSVDVVKSFLGGRNGREVAFCPDMAFVLDPRESRHPCVTALVNKGSSQLFGLNISGLLYSGGYTRDNMFALKSDYPSFIAALVQALLANPVIRIVLIPHTYGKPGSINSDPDGMRAFLASYKGEHQNRISVLWDELDQHELKWVISRCDFFVGSRMHACIGALSQMVPTIGAAYSKKFIGIFESVEMGEYVVDLRDVTGEKAVERIVTLFERRDSVREMLEARIPRIQQSIRECFRRIPGLL